MANEIASGASGSRDVALGSSGELGSLMASIRPQWQTKGLIERVYRLLPVDLSSACQRLLNAAVADLREKIVVAGIDIADECAQANKLPSVKRPEDIENYSTANVISLSYRMGLVSRPDWRRLTRAYEIRRDLEHEDSEYEATREEAAFMFRTCIEAVLSVDPVSLLRVEDVKQVIEASGPAAIAASLQSEFRQAPDGRQLEIAKFLYSVAQDDAQPDIVRENSYSAISLLAADMRPKVTVELAKFVQEKMGRHHVPGELEMRVCAAAGVVPYLPKGVRRSFYSTMLSRMRNIGHRWTANRAHGDLLSKVHECGGLAYVPEPELTGMVTWLTLCYIGEPGGYGAGRNRTVFYSNTGAPLVEELMRDASAVVVNVMDSVQADQDVISARASSASVERRFQDLLDFVGG